LPVDWALIDALPVGWHILPFGVAILRLVLFLRIEIGWFGS